MNISEVISRFGKSFSKETKLVFRNSSKQFYTTAVTVQSADKNVRVGNDILNAEFLLAKLSILFFSMQVKS